MSEFRSLYTALKGWYCRPLADYPNDLREWIVLGLGLGLEAERMQTWWFNKSPKARIAFAKQWDYQHDPATKEQRDDLENFFDDYERLEREIEKWEGIPAPDALNLAKKDEMLVSLRAQDQEMNLKRRQKRGDFEENEAAIISEEGRPHEKQDVEPELIDRNDVIGKFRVKADPDENIKFWDDKLGKPPKWLLPAQGQTGKAGISSLWKPLVIAHCLLGGVYGKPFQSLRQLDVLIHKGFPEWFDAWKEQTENER